MLKYVIYGGVPDRRSQGSMPAGKSLAVVSGTHSDTVGRGGVPGLERGPRAWVGSSAFTDVTRSTARATAPKSGKHRGARAQPAWIRFLDVLLISHEIWANLSFSCVA